MAKRKSNMRWRDSDVETIERAINNFNAKIYRQRRNHPERVDFLPDTVKKSEALDSIETRADFNKLVNSLQRFSRRGAEAPITSDRGAKATQWAVDEFNIKKRTVNAQRTRERKKIENKDVKVGGKTTGVKRAEMGSIRENEVKPYTKTFQNMSNKEWEKASAYIDKQLNAKYRKEKSEIMRENYIKGLRQHGYLDDTPELEKYIRGIDFDTFFETTQNDEAGTFDFYKDPIAYETRRNYLVNTWKAAYEGAVK